MNLDSFKLKYLINSNILFPINKSYAIVLSSPQLLENEHGAFIDSHDYVIRFNFAPTLDFQKHVGTKTTHRFLGGCNGQATYYRENQDIKVIRWCSTWIRECDAANNSQKYIEQDFLNMETYSEFFKNFHYFPCTSFRYNAGYKILSSMPLENRSISVFGYTENLNYKSYHYYDEFQNAENAKKIIEKYGVHNPWNCIINSASKNRAYHNHDYTETYNLTKKLSSENKINIIKE